MGNYFDRQPASRVIKMQNLAWTGSGTLVSTNFTGQTYQVRVIAQTAGWFAIDNLGTVPTTAGGNGVFIPASAAGGEYFTCSPGMLFSFSSTTTSSASPWVSISEMA
jgi:hypothetical protein